MKISLILLGFLSLMVGCDTIFRKTPSDAQNVDFLTTSDDVKLSSSFVDSGQNAILLLHQLNSDKSAYLGFQDALKGEGYSSIALDFRGHGNSDGDWQKFSENDFQNMVLDAEAAKSFLESRGKNVVGIVGASIGANIAAQMNAKHGMKAVLLSPGLNYRGIDFEGTIPELRDVLIVTSREDAYSAEALKKAKGINPSIKEIVLEGGGHGTNMLNEELEEEILGFFEK